MYVIKSKQLQKSRSQSGIKGGGLRQPIEGPQLDEQGVINHSTPDQSRPNMNLIIYEFSLNNFSKVFKVEE